MAGELEISIRYTKLLENQIAKACVEALNEHINANLSRIKNDFLVLVVSSITQTAEFRQLLLNDGVVDWEAEFGTKYVGAVMAQCIEIWKEEYKITFKPFKFSGGRVGGSFKFQAIDGNFNRILQIPYAEYQSRPSNEYISWLRWILLEGDKTIDDYEIHYDLSASEIGRSRTKRALMKKEELSHWVLEPPFRGDNTNNNFVTRGLATISPENFSTILQSIL